MKYIKAFEETFAEIEPVYKIGDYIKIIDDRIKSWGSPTPSQPDGYNIFKFAKITGDNPEDDFFNIKFEIIANNKLNVLYDNKNIIKRKLTKEEIEEYKVRKSAIKYNL